MIGWLANLLLFYNVWKLEHFWDQNHGLPKFYSISESFGKRNTIAACWWDVPMSAKSYNDLSKSAQSQFFQKTALLQVLKIYIQMQWELYNLWKTKLSPKIRSKSMRHQSEDTVDQHSQRLGSKQTRCFEIIASRKRTSSHKSARILCYCIWMSLCYTLPS